MGARVAAAILVAVCCMIAIGAAAVHQIYERSADLPSVTPLATEEAGVLAEPFVVRACPLEGYLLNRAFRDQLVDDCVNWSLRAGIAVPSIALHALRLQSIADDSLHHETRETLERCRQVLLNDQVYRRTGFGLPLLVDTAYGANFRTRARSQQSGAMGGAPHADSILAALSEAQIGLSEPIITASGRHDILRAVLEDSLHRASPNLSAQNDREIEWTVVAFSRFLRANASWANARGDKVSLEDLSRQLLELKLLQSACGGTHRLYAIASLINRSATEPGFLPSETTARIEAHLREVSSLLERSQLPDGSWDSSWTGVPLSETPFAGTATRTALEDRLQVTGHMLEWMALVPDSLRPPASTMQRAVVAVESLLRYQRGLCFDKHLLPSTHAVRALCLLSDDGREMRR